MKKLAYYDGIFTDYKKVRIPLSDRSIFFGDAVYDAALIRNEKMYLREDHKKRFLENVAAMNMRLPMSVDALDDTVSKLIRQFGASPAFFYIQASRKNPVRSHTYPNGLACHLLMSIEPIPLPSLERFISLITVDDRRYGFCAIKTVNLVPNVLASQKAQEKEAQEAVFLLKNEVTECAHSNIFLLQNGTIITRPLDGKILPGITRKTLLSLCREQGIPVEERIFDKEELMAAEEVFITSTSKLCVRSEKIDGVSVGKHTDLGNYLCKEMYMSFLLQTQ